MHFFFGPMKRNIFKLLICIFLWFHKEKIGKKTTGKTELTQSLLAVVLTLKLRLLENNIIKMNIDSTHR